MPEAAEAEVFYRYGFRGRDLIAIRSPFALSSDRELIGRALRVGAVEGRVVAVFRQISGPVQLGEPIGIELDLSSSAPLSAS